MEIFILNSSVIVEIFILNSSTIPEIFTLVFRAFVYSRFRDNYSSFLLTANLAQTLPEAR
jgi:hypothetical protein